MADYKEMYLHLMRETEKAVQILIQAQRDCEELYLQEEAPALWILPKDPEIPHNFPASGQPMENPSK